MPKFTNNQYFALVLAALVTLVALTILKMASADILVGILVGILYAGAHINGVNTGVPLQVTDPVASPKNAPTPLPSERMAA